MLHMGLCSLILLILIAYGLAQISEEVVVSSEGRGFERASMHEDHIQLYRDNLEADFLPFKETEYHVSDLLQMLQEAMKGRPPKHLTLLVVRDRKLHALPLTKVQPPLTTKRVAYLLEGMNNATRLGLEIQDTVVLLNTWDEPRCRLVGDCPVPVFSLIKQWHWGNSTGVQSDVLVPFFNHLYGDIINFNWEQKSPKALMRAAAQNGMNQNCTRLWLLQLAQSGAGQELLDVGITNNLKKGLKVSVADFVDIPSHAKWKYLLSTDGFTASCRFGKLLQTNSVVLKEESQWIEYYYRSVRPGQHFYPFNKDNVMQVLQQCQLEDSLKLQDVASAGQHFAYRYLSQFSKSLYFSKAVEFYNHNFKDGQAFVASLKAADLTSLDRILAAMASHVKRR